MTNSSENTAPDTTIITTDATTIQTNEKPTMHIEHLFLIEDSKRIGLEVMQSYPPRVLDRRLQEDWARAAKEGPGVLMNLRVDFLSPWAKAGSTLLCKY